MICEQLDKDIPIYAGATSIFRERKDKLKADCLKPKKILTVRNATEGVIFEQSLIHALRWLPDGSINRNLRNVCGGGECLQEKDFFKSDDIYVAEPMEGFKKKSVLTPTLNKNELIEFSTGKWEELVGKYDPENYWFRFGISVDTMKRFSSYRTHERKMKTEVLYSVGDEYLKNNGEVTKLNNSDIALMECYLILQGSIFTYLNYNGMMLNTCGGANRCMLDSSSLALYFVAFERGHQETYQELFSKIKRVKTKPKWKAKITIDHVFKPSGYLDWNRMITPSMVKIKMKQQKEGKLKINNYNHHIIF